jgi:hypothetical protein
MQGILKQVKKTLNEVSFDIIDVSPPEGKYAIEYVLLRINGQGLRLGRKLQNNELITDFSSSNTLCTKDNLIFILPDVILDDIILKQKFKNYQHAVDTGILEGNPSVG